MAELLKGGILGSRIPVILARKSGQFCWQHIKGLIFSQNSEDKVPPNLKYLASFFHIDILWCIIRASQRSLFTLCKVKTFKSWNLCPGYLYYFWSTAWWNHWSQNVWQFWSILGQFVNVFSTVYKLNKVINRILNIFEFNKVINLQ